MNLLLLTLAALLLAGAGYASGDGATGDLTTRSAWAVANEGGTQSVDPAGTAETQDSSAAVKAGGAGGGRSSGPRIEYRYTLGCGDQQNVDGSLDTTNCTYALQACAFRGKPDAILYYLWSRRAGSHKAWRFLGETCGMAPATPQAAGAPPPPAVPTFADIQRAYRELPFARPVVRIEPVGGTTLVNLPTYYETTWPAPGLAPGDVSAPVQLLSWTVRFRISLDSHTYRYGDGTSSEPTTSPGGPYPDGDITHTYTHPVPTAKVTVDTRLTGQYRVDNGPWQDIATVADLQDEPVTTLHVREATARLYQN